MNKSSLGKLIISLIKLQGLAEAAENIDEMIESQNIETIDELNEAIHEEIILLDEADRK